MVWVKTTLGKFDYEKSTRKDKKLMVVVNGKKIHFGHPNYQQYKDRTGIWKHKDHGDFERRLNYLDRSGGIKNASGRKTKDDIESPNYHAIEILW